MLITLLFSVAHAQLYLVTFCAKYQVDYKDSDTFVSGSTDFFRTNSEKAARGARVRVVTNDGISMQDFAVDSGPNRGCAGPFLLDSDRTHEVFIDSIAEVNGNTIRVVNATNTLYSSKARSSFSPSGPNTSYTVNIKTKPDHQPWRVAAVAGFALHRHRAGLTGVTFDLFIEHTGQCPLGSCSANGRVYLSNTGTERRFIIAHELGHAVAYFRDGNPSFEYQSAPGRCYSNYETGASHEMNSKEYASAAAVEGWAHFYAAATFNKTNEQDCGFVYYKSQDYDLLLGNEVGNLHWLSCEDGPLTSGVPNKDYLGVMCDGSLTNRGTELDWLRFWWDMKTDDDGWSISFTDCANIYADADPHSWIAASGVGPDTPYWRTLYAASALGFVVPFLDKADNGIGP